MKNKLILYFTFLLAITQSFAQADFTASTTCGSGFVNFTNVTPGYTGGWLSSWDFGDGNTSILDSPGNTYATAGIYAVGLTVTGPGPVITSKTISVLVPAVPAFTYPFSSVCMSSVAASVTGISPSSNFAGLGGSFDSAPAGLGGFLDNVTGDITYSSNIPTFVYQITYSYNVPGCGTLVSTTAGNNNLGLGYAKSGPITGTAVATACNRERLTIDPNAKGSLQWQVFTTVTGTWINFPNTGEGSPIGTPLINPINSSNRDYYVTPTLTVTSQVRAVLSDPVCGTLYSDNTLPFLIRGVSTPGTASTTSPIICGNTSPTLTLSGYLGAVTWQISTNGTSWSASTGTNASVAQVFPPAASTVHVPSPIVSIGNVFFRAAVQYTEFGSNCLITYSNVVTISSEFCTVTSRIITPVSITSNICASQGVVQFSDNSFPSGSSVATITSWNWSFQNGTPSSSSSQNPPFVTFPTSNTANTTNLVSLTVTGQGGTSSIATFIVTIDGVTDLTGISPSGNFTLCGGNLLTLTGLSANANPVFQWYNSPDNVTYSPISPGGSGRSFVTPIITSNIYYKVSAQNGVCPGTTTAGTSVTLIPTLTISPNFNTPGIITFCEGQRAILTATGINGTISFEISTVAGGGGPYTPLSGVSLISTDTYQTPYFLTAGTMYVRAVIQNTFNCTPATSGFYTISVTSCAINPTISVTSSYFPQRTCRDISVFNFVDNTASFPGITITAYNWDFGLNASPATASGPNPGAIAYGGSGDLFPTVILSVSGTSGSITTVYTKSIVLTIDGVSTAIGINTLTGSPTICKNTSTNLTLSGANPNANFQWEESLVSSLSGWTSLGATDSRFYTTVPLVNAEYYRTLVTNGVCPTYTTPGILVNIQPDVVISPVGPSSLAKCYGESASLSVSAANGNLKWQTSPDGISSWADVTTGSGFNTSSFTTTYLYATKYYRASITDPLGCLTSVSGVFTVSISACPITPVISVTSPLLFQRTCYDQPNFSFKDITPAIPGVTFVRADWDFDIQASVSYLSTVSGAPAFPVTYTQMNTLRDIQNVRLTITGISGVYTYTGTSFVNVTIDGLPTITGLRSNSNDLCTGNGGTTLLADPTSNPVINTPGIRWYVSSAPGLPYNEILPNPSSSAYITPPLTTTTSYKMTADNGACSTFTTPGLTIRVYEQPVISSFTYPTPLCNSNTSIVSPIIVRSGSTVPGIFYVSSANSAQITINAQTGAITPIATVFPSNVSETFTVNYSVSGIGQCTSPSVPSFDVMIGKQLPTPIFGYSNSPYCSNQLLASRIYNFGEGSYPYYYSSSDLTVNTSTGVVDLQSVIPTSGIANINFIIPTIAGCSSLVGTATITVTSAPTVGDFSYPNSNSNYCSDEGVISPTPTGYFDPLGYWSISPNSGISISSTTGVITLTGSTLTDLYTIIYTNPARGGCYFSATKQHAIFVYQLPSVPVFHYGPTLIGINAYCSSNNNIPLPTKISGNFTLGQFVAVQTDFNINASNGKITVPSNTTQGIRDIKYVIQGIGPCATRTIEGTAQINLIKVPEPSFGYESGYVCNELASDINPNNLVDASTINGTFFVSTANTNFIYVNSLTGVVSVTTFTPTGNYDIFYKTPLPPACGSGADLVSKNPASVYVEQVPTVPQFGYGIYPMCSGVSRQLFTSSGVSIVQNSKFDAPTGFNIGSSLGNLGTLYPNNPPDGFYTITCTNRSVIVVGNVVTTTCPIRTNTAVITISSTISIPFFNYGGDGKFCSDDARVKSVNISLIPGGHFFATPGSSTSGGLRLNTITGNITISGSNTSGSNETPYSIFYQVDGVLGCPEATQKTDIIIYKKLQQPNISYKRSNGTSLYPFDYCQDENPIFPAGTFSGGSFNSAYNVSIDGVNGRIDLGSTFKNQSSDSSVIYVTYNINALGACPALSASTSLTLTSPYRKEVKYSYDDFLCKTDSATSKLPIVRQPLVGTFTGAAGLIIDKETGAINVKNTLIPKTYLVEYRYDSKGPCAAGVVPVAVTISTPSKTPSFYYAGSPYCKSGKAIPQNANFTKGTFSASRSNVFIDEQSGVIDLSKSDPANGLIITYTIPPLEGCPIITGSDTLSIRAAVITEISSEQEQGLLCGGGLATIKLDSGRTNGIITMQQHSYKDTNWVDARGTFNGRKFVTEKLTDTTYFRAHADYNGCPDNKYSRPIRVQVIPGSKGGTATTIDNETYVQICGVQTYQLTLSKDHVGDITWLYSKDTTRSNYTDKSRIWTEVDPINHLELFETPKQNGRGLKIWYKAKVINQNCKADSSNSVLVEVCSAGIDVPNALTPASGNEVESHWDLTRLKLVPADNVKVFNRYGSKVFESGGANMNDLQTCWTGDGLPTGTYYYIIVFSDQTIATLVGTVSIIR